VDVKEVMKVPEEEKLLEVIEILRLFWPDRSEQAIRALVYAVSEALTRQQEEE